MKHIKLFENRSVQSMKNVINEYNDLYEYLKPVAFAKYDELAKDVNYEPKSGDSPYIMRNDHIVLQNINIVSEGFEFVLQTFNDEAQVQGTFYVTIEDPEIYTNSKKYNL